jgi:uncharacterized phage protein gp47/JayE
MTTYGLTTTGFVSKSLAVVRSDLDQAMRAAFGQSLTLGDSSILGQIDGIMAERYAELWALAQAVYNSQDPNAATGLSLDNVCALTGTLRPQATFSTVTLWLTGSTGTVNSGEIVKTNSTGFQFQTTQAGTLTTQASWAATTAYVTGNVVTNSGNIYLCTTSGTSAGSGGPTVTTLGSPITDNTVTWYFLGAGTAAVSVPAIAVLTGPIFAAAWDLSTIVTPAAVLQGVTNPLDCVLGAAVYSDQQLRLLREEELAGSGTSTQNAIQAGLLKTLGVVSATVQVNNSDVTDSNGLTPHSIEALVLGGADADVAATLFNQVAAGIATCPASGGTSVTVYDSQNNPHVINFLRPTTVPIYVIIHITYNALTWPSDGSAEVQDAITVFGDGYAVGFNVVSSALLAQAFSVPGVLDVPLIYIGTAPSPSSSATIPITYSQLATFSTANITVVAASGTP